MSSFTTKQKKLALTLAPRHNVLSLNGFSEVTAHAACCLAITYEENEA